MGVVSQKHCVVCLFLDEKRHVNVFTIGKEQTWLHYVIILIISAIECYYTSLRICILRVRERNILITVMDNHDSSR